MRNGNAPPTDMIKMPTTAAGLNPIRSSTAPDTMLTGTEMIPVILFANMIVVMLVSAKWCENAAIEGVRIANSLIVQNSARMPTTFIVVSFPRE